MSEITELDLSYFNDEPTDWKAEAIRLEKEYDKIQKEFQEYSLEAEKKLEDLNNQLNHVREKKHDMEKGYNTYNIIIDLIGENPILKEKWDEFLGMLESENPDFVKKSYGYLFPIKSKVKNSIQPLSTMEQSMMETQARTILSLREENKTLQDAKRYLGFLELLKDSETLQQEWVRFMTMVKLTT